MANSISSKPNGLKIPTDEISSASWKSVQSWKRARPSVLERLPSFAVHHTRICTWGTGASMERNTFETRPVSVLNLLDGNLENSRRRSKQDHFFSSLILSATFCASFAGSTSLSIQRTISSESTRKVHRFANPMTGILAP